MDQYLLMPFLGGWTSIYQLFWCELQGYKVLTHCHMGSYGICDGILKSNVSHGKGSAFSGSLVDQWSIPFWARKKYEKMIGHVFSFDWEIPFGGCDVSLFWFVNLLNFQDSMIANRPCDEHLNREGVAHTFLASCNIAKKPGRANPKHWPQATVNQ